MQGKWETRAMAGGGMAGLPLWEGNYREGKPDGEILIYGDVQHISKHVYKQGSPTGTWVQWLLDSGGWSYSKGEMSPNGRQGTWTFKWDTGEVLKTGKYLDGKEVGQWRYACANKNWRVIDDSAGTNKTIAIEGPDGKQLAAEDSTSLCPSLLEK
jgi:hypothetical protein